MNRRNFLKGSSIKFLTSVLGAKIVFLSKMPKDYLPVLIQNVDPYQQFGKHPEMILLNDRPVNMEAMAHLLDDDITPADKMFIRNNGIVPKDINVENWQLLIDGESVLNSKSISLAELKSSFPKYSYQLTLECGGNGRSEFNPPAKGNQWTIGAVSCATWTGARLRDVLKSVGIKNDAKYIGYYGADTHLSGDRNKNAISRGVPLAKALQDETLLAYEMNGAPIPLAHGFPLRLVAGGWPASASGKWINRISIRNIIHDGSKMGGQSYRIPCEPVAPGSEVPDDEMCIIESMPVKSLITYPKTGAVIRDQPVLKFRGHAWAGELAVIKVEYSIDFGSSWHQCDLKKASNRMAWQQWSGETTFPEKGYYELWVKATDEQGESQPMVLPGWNPRGYLNNACHRIAVKYL